jgi:nucleotide-binding universal stress UspA family protein
MIQRILVPIDGGEGSARATAACLALVRQTGAVAVAFLAEPMPPIALHPLSPSALEAAQRQHTAMTEAHAQEVLARFEQLAGEAGAAFEAHLVSQATTDRAVVAAARALQCDLVVLAVQGRGAFGEFLFGSQTKALLAGSGMPLFIVP